METHNTTNMNGPGGGSVGNNGGGAVTTRVKVNQRVASRGEGLGEESGGTTTTTRGGNGKKVNGRERETKTTKKNRRKLVVTVHEARNLVSRSLADAEKVQATIQPFVVVKVGKWHTKGKVIRQQPQTQSQSSPASSASSQQSQNDLNPVFEQTFTGDIASFGRRATSLRILMFDRDTNDVFVRTARGANVVLSGNTIYLPGIWHGKGHHFVGRAAVLLSSIPGFYDSTATFASNAAAAVSRDEAAAGAQGALDDDGDGSPSSPATSDHLEGTNGSLEYLADVDADNNDTRAEGDTDDVRSQVLSVDTSSLTPSPDGDDDHLVDEKMSPSTLPHAETMLQRGGGPGPVLLMKWLTLYSKSGKPVGSLRVSVKVVNADDGDDDDEEEDDDEDDDGSGESSGAEGGATGADDVDLDDTLVEKYAASLALAKAHWEEVGAETVNVRGENYLSDKKKLPSSKQLLKLEAVEIVGVEDVDTHVTKTSGRGVADAMKRAGVDEVSTAKTYVVIHFVVPADKLSAANAYSLAMYYSFEPTPADSGTVPTKGEKLLRRWLIDGDTELANSRIKLIPRIVKGPWTMKQLVGAPCMLGKYSKLTFERTDSPVDCHEIVIDCVNSERLRSKFSQIVRNIGDMVVDLAFVLQGEDIAELPEQLFATIRLSQLDLSAVPDWHSIQHTRSTTMIPQASSPGGAQTPDAAEKIAREHALQSSGPASLSPTAAVTARRPRSGGAGTKRVTWTLPSASSAGRLFSFSLSSGTMLGLGALVLLMANGAFLYTMLLSVARLEQEMDALKEVLAVVLQRQGDDALAYKFFQSK